MIYSYKDCIEEYGTDYKLKNMIAEEKLFQIEKGVYSDKKRITELELISFKYPKAIFTLDTAFYCHGLTDVIPDLYMLNTDRDAPKMKDKRVKQCFCSSKLLGIGKTQMDYQGVNISIYNLERLMIELVRYKDKIPYDYYKEVVHSFRQRIYEIDIDIEKIQEYIPMFSASSKIQNTIEKEIF